VRSRTKLVITALVVLGVALGSLLGGVLRERDAASGVRGYGQVETAFAADRVLSGIAASGGTDTRELERAVGTHPNDSHSLVLLGYAYQQRWRETADASHLPRSEAALRRASRLDPTDPLAVTGLGSLALIRHDFRKALALGRWAQRLAPSSARPYGVVGDALIELGRYEEAFRAFERMVTLRPSVASYARIAYARELLGDLSGARRAMQLAADAAAGQREPGAWANVELAKLDLRAGRVGRAEMQLRVALELLPGYVFALEQLARVEAARGNVPRAIGLARRAAEAVPLPQFVSLLADLHERAGNRRAAGQQLATVAAIDRLLAANGVRTDVESVVFDADHRIRPATLVERARAARLARPSILGDDALAWALARTGRCAEARGWSDRSLRLGTRDALLYFHRAEIERCAGNSAAARTWARKALAHDAAFSVRWAPRARRLAA
jgi:tetratricopeptide (TPR) repeat protein